MILTDRNARAVLTARLQPGETLLHHAYGVKQPSRPGIVALYVFCLLVPAALILRRVTKHFLVGLTDRRLIVLPFLDLAQPEAPLEYLRGAVPMTAKQGWFWTHLNVVDAQRPFSAKFHRVALPHNREQVRAIAEAFTGQPLGG